MTARTTSLVVMGLMLAIVGGWFATGFLTGGNAIRLHEQDHGVRRLTVCHDAAGYIGDHERAERDWGSEGCTAYPVKLGACLEDPQAGEAHVHLCDAHELAKPCDEMQGRPGHTEVREGGAAVITYAPGAEYMHVRHEAGHLRLSEGHTSVPESWMAAGAGEAFVGIECGEVTDGQ